MKACSSGIAVALSLLGFSLFSMTIASAQCPIAKLLEPVSNEVDEFGYQVCLEGTLAVVTELGEHRDGSVHFFLRTGTGRWVETQELRPDDGYAGQEFGGSLALDGNVLVVGASRDHELGNNQGAAYVFLREESESGGPGNWFQAAKLLPSGLLPGEFGGTVDVSGGTIAVGLNPDYGSEAAFLFERNDQGTTDPHDDTWVQTAAFEPDGLSPTHQFGQSVALSEDGNLLVVGDRGDTSLGEGAYLPFHRNDAGTPDNRLDDTWLLGNKFSVAPDNFMRLGSTARIDGDWILGSGSSAGTDGAGRAFTFLRDDQGTANPVDDTWELTQILKGSTVGFYQGFGDAMAIDGNLAVIGSSTTDGRPHGGGRCYVFENQGGTWVETSVLQAPDEEHLDRVGTAIALEETTLLLGAHGQEFYDDYAPAEGAVYEVELSRPSPWENLGHEFRRWPLPQLAGFGCLEPGSRTRLRLYNCERFSAAFLILGMSVVNLPFKDQLLVPAPDYVLPVTQTSEWGSHDFLSDWSSEFPSGTEFFFQAFAIDPYYEFGVEASNAVRATVP